MSKKHEQKDLKWNIRKISDQVGAKCFCSVKNTELGLDNIEFEHVNNNWISDDWFQTWPLMNGFVKSKETLHSKVPSHNRSKCVSCNIVSLDVITNNSGSHEFLATTSAHDCDKLTKQHKRMDKEPVDQNKLQFNSMDHVLENLPLVYNPSTKKLQIARLKSSTKILTLQNTFKFSCSGNVIDDTATNAARNTEEVALLESEACDKNCHSTFNTKHECFIEEDSFDTSSPSVQSTDSNVKPLISSNCSSGIVQRSNIRTSFTDGSSFSSSATDVSNVSSTDSAICLKSYDNHYTKESDSPKKKKGITDFISRNFFSWKHKEGKSNINGLKCDKDSVSLSSNNSFSLCDGSNSSNWTRVDKREYEKSSVNEMEAGSAGLIMECRPRTLPAKTADEEERHRQEYESIVTAAKKREVKEAKEKKKAQAAQMKLEKQLVDAVKIWNTTILPKWSTMRYQKKCLDLWWNGLPSCIRGKIWKLAIGNDLNITFNLYHILLERSVDQLGLVPVNESQTLVNRESLNQESTLNLITLDVSRTFAQLCIFQKGGPFHDPLHNILGAYACYRPDVGYVQGMSFLAATLLLNMDESEAFVSFANLLNRPVHLTFFSINQPVMEAYYKTFEELLSENLPRLSNHLIKLTVSPDMYFLDWILTVFASSLPLDVTARIWDVYFRDDVEFLFKAALGILKHYERDLIALECTTMTAQFLVHLPEDLCCDALFKTIATVRASFGKKSFSEILSHHIQRISTT